MKKVVLNISEVEYEKFKFEALLERKGVSEVIRDRLFYKPFDQDVEEAFDDWFTAEFYKVCNEQEETH